MNRLATNSIWALVAVLFAATYAVAARPPNIVFVLADDLGWAELGCYGNGFNETPNLDRLAVQGMRFTHAYAAAPVCSPYRAALLTGQHPARIGILDYLRPNSANALPTTLTTLPEVLSEKGYATGMVGKWHLTGYRHHGAEFEIRPTDHGFDWNVGSEVKGVGNGANFWPYVFREQATRWIDFPENRLGEDEYLTDRLNVEAIEFIERNRDQPFFLYLSHYAPHTILNGRPDLVQKYRDKHPPGKSGRERCYLCEDAGLGKGDPGNHWAVDHNPHLAAMLESIDNGVGLIADKLETLGLAENTIFIFTSDNGGESNVTSNAPLRGGKSELYEGGVRVPLIVRWPKGIPAGSVCEQATQNVDFYPTLLAAAQIDADPDQILDGVSTLETWKDPANDIGREFLAWHYPLDRPHFLGGFSGGAIRSGDWKLIEHFDTGEVQLFSLADDPGEATDLAEQRPPEVARLRQQLASWRRSVRARTPSPPLLTEARQLYFAEHFNPEQLSERLWYNADWKAEAGVLKRLDNGSDDNTRIFLRDAEYRDALIRFDFRLGDAKDVRLMTGGGGGYNTVLHLRPDHFFLQTAKDSSVPYFSYRHGECAYEFEPDRWYTMTIEFLGDEAIAHLDHQHIVYAKHPIIDRTRDYFALQVDAHAAEFDNVQVFTAVERKAEEGRGTVEAAAGKFPVDRTPEEEFSLRKSNAHEWYYQNDGVYRALVLRVDELDRQRKQRFPDAFRSHKEYKKAIQAERKHLNATDTVYKETLHATHRAERAIDTWLIAQQPKLADLPSNRKKTAIQQLRRELNGAPELMKLTEQATQAQQKLEAAYPQLFVSNEQINAKKRAAAEAVRKDAGFQKLSKERSAAYRARQDYLLSTDEELKRLDALMNSASGPPAEDRELDYHFDGRISRKVLENYLARSATVASLLHLASDDDLRMMRNTGAKFAGRVIWMWGSESRIDALVEKGEPFVKRIHAMDPDIILQGAIFEIVTTDVDKIPIPAAIFEEFGLEPEERNFRYMDMLYPSRRRVDHWGKGASVPDMSRLETRMWFVYVGKRWIDMGIEAIHFGQVALMDDRDRDHAHWRDMLARLRSYATKHARRHFILADAHTPSGGIVHGGKLMFDLHSFPSRPKSVKGKPRQAILEKGFSDSIYGRSKGGLTPSGWTCESLPYIVELDNFGSSDHPGEYRESDRFHVWGWDEIGWFGRQPEAYRNEWLEYAYSWVRDTDPNGFFQLPLRRFEHYTASMTAPKGQRQEETIQAIWEAADEDTEE